MTSGTTETAADQVARLLALVPYILAHGEVRLDEAATRFGVSPRQLDKDLRLLFLTGLSPGLPGDLIEVDIDALEGEGVIRVANADYLARPIRFAPAEATALIVALRTMLDQAGDESSQELLRRTLAKLEAAAGADPETILALHVDQDAAPGAEYVPVLESAISQARQVRLDYHVPSRDERTQRIVDPRAVARVENVLYLDAWCHTAGGERVFRLDRILGVEVLESAVADPMSRPRDLTDGWFAEAQAATVTLRLQAPAFWVSEYFPVLDRREGPDATLDVDLSVGSEDWLTRLLLRLAPYARLLDDTRAPAAFAQHVRQTLTLYTDDE